MFLHKTKINFYDCDPAGILFFGRVFDLAHQAYEAMINSFELGEDYWNNPDYVVPILNAESHYHHPMKYGEIISVQIKVTNLKSSSFELSYLFLNENSEKCCEVKTVHVFVDRKTWKKNPMSEKISGGLSRYKD